MDQALIGRVKNSLNKQAYTMNDSWLAECIEYYLEEHENSTQDEIITFVINQWVLSDLREMNNENGCLPRNLSQQKCTKLNGKYILQMNKMYDISTSKYKQLENIRNVSSENVEATENENIAQEDKFQAWEPKSKRMFQLFLTDGVQDISAIEYKPIRFLKDNLYPGYKLAIKGPIICRRGVLLLEETNITEVGGEVESLLIVNAVENIFARALNLKENPDPYGDNKKLEQNTQSQSTQQSVQIEDDFDMDSEMIDLIEKQIQQQNSSNNTCSSRPVARSEQNQISGSRNNASNSQGNIFNANKSQGSTYSSITKAQKQNYNNLQSKTPQFGDDDDSFLEMVDENAFENLPIPKSVQQKSSNKQPPSRISRNRNIDDYPIDGEIYNVSGEQSPFFDTSKPQNETSVKKSNLLSKTPSISSVSNNKKIFNQNERIDIRKNALPKNVSSEKSNKDLGKKNSTWNIPSPPQKTIINAKPTSSASDFPDDDFDMDDFDIKTDESKMNSNDKKQISCSKQVLSNVSSKLHNSNKKVEPSTYQTKETSPGLPHKTNISNCDTFENLEDEFEVEFECKMENSFKSENQKETQNNEKLKIEKINETLTTNTLYNTGHGSTVEYTGAKRLASTISPFKDTPQKIRCVQNTPTDKTKNRKITDFLGNSQASKADDDDNSILREDMPKVYELIIQVLKKLTDSGMHTVVRGKVVNIIKLDLFKTEKGPSFHLEGTITDGTAKLDVVFSSKVLEKVIGFSPEEFCQKRKQSKTNPTIKDQLREDLRKAQQILRYMDVYMEIKLKNRKEKAVVLKTLDITKEQKHIMDSRLQEFLSVQ